MQSSQEATKSCTMCGKATTQLCKTCSSSVYCSRSCQKSDWPVHKKLCSEFKNISTPPGESYRRGLLFPDREFTPRFIWVSTLWRSGTLERPAHEYIDESEHLRTQNNERIRISGNNLRNRYLNNHIEAIYSGLRLSLPYGVLNLSISQFAGSNMDRTWFGPILVMKLDALERYCDVDMVDFRDAVDLFCSYPKFNISDMRLSLNPTTTTKPPREPGPNNYNAQPFASTRPTNAMTRTNDGIPVVRLNCVGTQMHKNRRAFEPIKVPATHPVFQAPITGISSLIGLPIRVIRCEPYEDPYGGPSLNIIDMMNLAAKSLHLSVNPDNENWGISPQEWRIGVGNVILARADCEPLLPEHADAICYFCQYVMNPLFDHSNGMGFGGLVSKGQVLEAMSPKRFHSFCLTFNNWNVDNNSS